MRQAVHTGPLLGDGAHDAPHQFLERDEVAFEFGEHIDRPNPGAGLDPRIEVGDQSDCRIADLEFRARTASGWPVMLISENPCLAYHWLSARVENLGPSITTMVPPSTTPGTPVATARRSGQ
mgnify:CR=1 FL=1